MTTSEYQAQAILTFLELTLTTGVGCQLNDNHTSVGGARPVLASPTSSGVKDDCCFALDSKREKHLIDRKQNVFNVADEIFRIAG